MGLPRGYRSSRPHPHRVHARTQLKEFSTFGLVPHVKFTPETPKNLSGFAQEPTKPQLPGASLFVILSEVSYAKSKMTADDHLRLSKCLLQHNPPQLPLDCKSVYTIMSFCLHLLDSAGLQAPCSSKYL